MNEYGALMKWYW